MMFTVIKDAHVQLNRYLKRYPRDLEVFNNTEKSSEEDIYELMKEIATRVRGAKDVIEDWKLLLDTAKQLLYSFTPPGVEEHLIGVFWGSLANILRNAVSTVLIDFWCSLIHSYKIMHGKECAGV
jgi:hypothetical protein